LTSRWEFGDVTQHLLPDGVADAATYEALVLDRVRSTLEEHLEKLLSAGSPLPDPGVLADAMTAGIPDSSGASEYERLCGPFYSSTGVMRLLGIRTKQALDDRRRRGTVLAARTADRVWVYPAFQFDIARRRVKSDLVPVIGALKHAPRWGALLWLVTPQPRLGDRSPVDAASGHEAERVVNLAQDYANAAAS
jgi:hypothetical protein